MPIEKEVLSVEGMTCKGCKKRIEEAVRELGVEEVTALYDEDRVEVAYNPDETDLAKIRSTIIQLGDYWVE